MRDGLMAYDRKIGGWRGPVAHLDGRRRAFRTDWAAALGQVARPPGMLPDWRLAVVLEHDGPRSEGRLARAASGPTTPEPRARCALPDLGWARPVRDGKPGRPRVAWPTSCGRRRRHGRTADRGNAAAAPAPAGRQGAGAAPRRLAWLLRQIPQVQGALVSLDPRTGRVLAMVGGWSFEHSQFNRATQAQRQPGSSFKPFVYLTALEQGISPSQQFLDAPSWSTTAGGRGARTITSRISTVRRRCASRWRNR